MYLTLFVGFLCWSLFCYALLCIISSSAIILMRKRELVALLFCFYCLPGALWLLVTKCSVALTLPWICLQFVIVVLPNHTYFLFDILQSIKVISQSKCRLYHTTEK